MIIGLVIAAILVMVVVLGTAILAGHAEELRMEARRQVLDRQWSDAMARWMARKR